MHSRFKPRRREVENQQQRRHPAGDVPGSRTHPDSAQARLVEYHESVAETVTVDANDLFTQLSTTSYLGKRGPRGLLMTIQDVTEGTIRVWRDWLSKRCESRSWSNQDAVTIIRGDGSSSSSTQTGTRMGISDPTNDPAVLWVNTRDNLLGIKFRVKERKWQRTATPLIYSSDIEIAASYEVVFEGRHGRWVCCIPPTTNTCDRGLCQDTSFAVQARGGRPSTRSPFWQGHCLWVLRIGLR